MPQQSFRLDHEAVDLHTPSWLGDWRLPSRQRNLVVYAAEFGQVAEDGAGGHSPFTAALARRLAEPGLEVRRMFDVVTADVLDVTGGHQRPYQYGSNPAARRSISRRRHRRLLFD